MRRKSDSSLLRCTQMSVLRTARLPHPSSVCEMCGRRGIRMALRPVIPFCGSRARVCPSIGSAGLYGSGVEECFMSGSVIALWGLW